MCSFNSVISTNAWKMVKWISRNKWDEEVFLMSKVSYLRPAVSMVRLYVSL
jgi:hypothetical protein